jgi:tRNA threonylcarbamoyladenosine biosynthesis protein TsaE
MNNKIATQFLADEQQTLACGGELAKACGQGAVIFLYGNLGAGKTTFTRGFLRGLGYEGKVKSPTYTIVEPYEVKGRHVFHFDFYRISHPEELEFIGIQDYFVAGAILIIEWPEHGSEILPHADLSCFFEPYQTGRKISLVAHSLQGEKIVNQFIRVAHEK